MMVMTMMMVMMMMTMMMITDYLEKEEDDGKMAPSMTIVMNWIRSRVFSIM